MTRTDVLACNYRSYFDPDFVFDDDDVAFASAARSHVKFSESGFSESESQALVASGYTVLLDDLVIDRFYGGAISSYDMKSRLPLKDFRRWFGSAPNRLPLLRAESRADLERIIEDLRTANRHPLIFRGQTSHYALARDVPNPSFVHETLGEISLLPSVWRRVLQERPGALHHFRDLSMMEWSLIIYDLFDLREVHEHEKRLDLFPGSFATDELPPDPDYKLVRDFHTHRDAFLNAFRMGGSPAFLTLLQHYGLYSPVLDLTSDPQVALFFATQKFARSGERARYDFAGTNERRAIIYVLRQDRDETLAYERDKMLEELDPQRPKRQACVVMPTSPYAMNLAGDFLVAAIQLDFDMTEPGSLTAEHLFPGAAEDRLLGAFRNNLHDGQRAALTEFF